jgi:predicted phosphohydrolase
MAVYDRDPHSPTGRSGERLMSLRLAFTADLHWGSHARGDDATRQLVDFLAMHLPDAVVIAGDVGSGQYFAECLALFDRLSCHKLLVPGNHDIWVVQDDDRGDSLQVYSKHLPQLCAKHHFHYLDYGPLLLPEADVAFVGSMNWYDYSWSIDLLRQRLSDWEKRLRLKVFSRGRHNDARFVRWPIDDIGFTAQAVGVVEDHLRAALAKVGQVILVTHHPPFYGLAFPRVGEPSDDALLWDAFAGNRLMEEVLSRNAARIAFAFCGHTHRAREHCLESIRGYNIGGDYHFKRLLLLEWPAGQIEAHTFGNPDPRMA